MTDIGILGGNENDVLGAIDVLAQIYKNDGKQAEIIPIYANMFHDINSRILICLDSTYDFAMKKIIANMCTEDVVLVNADDPLIFSSIGKVNARLITFGFNNKSSITCSSVMDENFMTVQLCIQRSFSTFSQKEVCEQEFSVSVQQGQTSVHGVLGSIGAALIDDIPIDFLQNLVIEKSNTSKIELC